MKVGVWYSILEDEIFEIQEYGGLLIGTIPIFRKVIDGEFQEIIFNLADLVDDSIYLSTLE